MRRLRGHAGDRPPESGTRLPRRRRLVAGNAFFVVAGVLLAAVLVGLVLVLAPKGRTDLDADGGSTPTLAEGTSASASPTLEAVPPTAVSPSPTGNAEDPPPALSAVPLDATAEVGDGVSATLPRIEAIRGTGRGPGNMPGPAVRLTVRIHNGTGQPVSVDGVAVNMAYGADLTPASPLDDPSQAPFRGTVNPGQSADGVYVFSVPSDARDSVTVEVGYRAGAPLLVFTGRVD
jgi:hypothetical protein